MTTLAEKLKEADIPFIWTVFTNDTKKDEILNLGIDSFVFKYPVLNIADYIADNDYLVQLSKNGEGFGYTPCEALCLGVPVLVTPCDAFKELGIIDGENGFYLDFDMNNVDVQKIYKSRLKFKYEPPKDIYGDLLEGKSNYNYEDLEWKTVQCIRDYCDNYTNETKTKMSEPYILKKTRAEYLEKLGFVKIL